MLEIVNEFSLARLILLVLICRENSFGNTYGRGIRDQKTLFKIYSQSACKLEMEIRHAKAYCNCVPWYLPNEGTGRYTICDKIGNHCFKKKRDEVKVSKEICPPSCEQIRFITSEIHKKIDPIKECEIISQFQIFFRENEIFSLGVVTTKTLQENSL